MKRKCVLLILMVISIFSFAQEIITMRNDNGIYTIPCTVNGLKLRFIFDTGAADVSISATEALFMLKNEYLSIDDIVDNANYTLADGTILENTIINISEIKIGSKTLTNVRACVVKNVSAPLLLGQSVIKELGPWYIDGDKLIFGKPLEQNTSSMVSNTPIEKCIEEAKKYESYGDYETAIELYKKACSIKNYANYYEFALFCLENYDNAKECKKNIPFYEIYQAALDKYQPMIDLLKRYPLVFGWDKPNGLRYYSDLIKTRGLWFLCDQAAYHCFNPDSFNDKIRGWELLQIGVEHNEPASISYLATLYDPNYYTGDLVEKNIQKAITLYKKAIELGDKSVLHQYGALLLEDKDNKDNYQLGISYLEKEGELGNVSVMFKLMEEYFYDDLDNEDKALYWAKKIINHQALSPLEKAYKSSHSYIKGIIGIIYFEQGEEEEAFSNLQSAHTNLTPQGPSCYSTLLLAECYYFGLGTSIDYSQAYKYYSESIKFEGGLSKSSVNYVYRRLGDQCSKGLGVDQNSSMAFSYYMKAANHDDPLAEASVADAYFDGNGIAKDINKAIFWFEKSAQQGHAYSWYSLGWIYARERYGYYNTTKAIECFNKAVECDEDGAYTPSCYYELGMIYEYGAGGVAKSYFKAGNYYKKAAELGHDKAKEKMKEFE